jgi:hypothetical protein
MVKSHGYRSLPIRVLVRVSPIRFFATRSSFCNLMRITPSGLHFLPGGLVASKMSLHLFIKRSNPAAQSPSVALNLLHTIRAEVGCLTRHVLYSAPLLAGVACIQTGAG